MSNKVLVLAVAFALRIAESETFTNPLLPAGPDPWVTYRDGFYYEMNSTGHNLTIRKVRDITDLVHAEIKVIWTPPVSGPYSHEIWAPELHFIRGKWYVYFAADAGQNESHRLWVLENSSADPLAGEWIMKGQLTDESNKWAIDGSVFEEAGRLYAIWSGWEGDTNGVQSIYIAAMANPWTITGARVKLSSPYFAWEKHGSEKPPNVSVNEGPEMLKHNGKLFLIYSASGCWTDFCVLGMLTAQADSNLLDVNSWKKSTEPVFAGDKRSHAYSPGHNGFFKSADGTQDWIIYHANSKAHQACGNHRSPRIQQFTWRIDGSPDFGTPVGLNRSITKPRSSRQQLQATPIEP